MAPTDCTCYYGTCPLPEHADRHYAVFIDGKREVGVFNSADAADVAHYYTHHDVLRDLRVVIVDLRAPITKRPTRRHRIHANA
jgi:hypothetical protein